MMFESLTFYMQEAGREAILRVSFLRRNECFAFGREVFVINGADPGGPFYCSQMFAPFFKSGLIIHSFPLLCDLECLAEAEYTSLPHCQAYYCGLPGSMECEWK